MSLCFVPMFLDVNLGLDSIYIYIYELGHNRSLNPHSFNEVVLSNIALLGRYFTIYISP